MTELNNLGTNTVAKLDQFAERASAQADEALAATRRVANGTLDKLQDSVDQIRHDGAGAFGRAAAQVDELARRGAEKVRHVSDDVREGVVRTSDRTAGYIQGQPLKSVLIAAAAGAALAALVGMLARSRTEVR